MDPGYSYNVNPTAPSGAYNSPWESSASSFVSLGTWKHRLPDTLQGHRICEMVIPIEDGGLDFLSRIHDVLLLSPVRKEAHAPS